jgi:hypothetical protein
MKPDPGKPLEEALELSPEARAALATSLLESLDELVRVRARARGRYRCGESRCVCTTRLIRERSSRLFALSHSALQLRTPQQLWE